MQAGGDAAAQELGSQVTETPLFGIAIPASSEGESSVLGPQRGSLVMQITQEGFPIL